MHKQNTIYGSVYDIFTFLLFETVVMSAIRTHNLKLSFLQQMGGEDKNTKMRQWYSISPFQNCVGWSSQRNSTDVGNAGKGTSILCYNQGW